MLALDFEKPRTRAAPTPTKTRDYFSFSAIKTYQTCPLRYFFKYVAGLPDDLISASLLYGSSIHKALEFHHRRLLAGYAPPSLDDLLGQYNESWAEREAEIRFGKGDDRASLDKLATKMLTAFQQHDLSKPAGKILGVEEELRGVLIPGLPDLLARIDLIVDTPAELVVSDWKTSRAKWSDHQVEDESAQLILYSELVKDLAPGKPLRVEFAVLTKTKEVAIDRHSMPVTPQAVDRTKRIVERVWNAIQSEVFYPAPSTMSCPSCPFREPCKKWPG